MFGLPQQIQPAQAMTLSRPLQAPSISGVGAAQANGIDISSLMGIMIPMMIVVMMMKMMTGAMGTATAS